VSWAAHRIFSFERKGIGRELRPRTALTASAASRLECRSPHIEKIIEKMVNENRGSHVGCVGVPELRSKIVVFPVT
jgi:hypothetical protein